LFPTVILAGGLGTRLSEETDKRPKPMVEIGGMPILWHIMKLYHHHGLKEFIVCLGYKGYMIKEYFANYALHSSDVTFDMAKDEMIVHNRRAEDWRITLVDTGAETMTGGRLKRVSGLIGDRTFCMTYGDGVGDVDIGATVRHHEAAGKLATVTIVNPPGRFGAVDLDGSTVQGFKEKTKADGGWINAGFFVLSPEVLERIEGDATSWEAAPLESLAHDGELTAYKHDGFWQPMDTLRDKNQLEAIWASGRAPWRVWS
jgi:glucose-1-phosphate cytidylyltransferase